MNGLKKMNMKKIGKNYIPKLEMNFDEKEIVMSIRMIVFFGIPFIILLMCWKNGSASIITVDDDGGADYTTIQNAIDNATEGDTIRVYEGNYSESIIIGKSISIIGNGSASTVITGGCLIYLPKTQ